MVVAILLLRVLFQIAAGPVVARADKAIARIVVDAHVNQSGNPVYKYPDIETQLPCYTNTASGSALCDVVGVASVRRMVIVCWGMSRGRYRLQVLWCS